MARAALSAATLCAAAAPLSSADSCSRQTNCLDCYDRGLTPPIEPCAWCVATRRCLSVATAPGAGCAGAGATGCVSKSVYFPKCAKQCPADQYACISSGGASQCTAVPFGTPGSGDRASCDASCGFPVPPPPALYACIPAQGCLAATTGGVSRESCEAACAGFACVGGACAAVTTGGVPEAQCRQRCGAPAPPAPAPAPAPPPGEWAECSTAADGHLDSDPYTFTPGPYGAAPLANVTWNGTLFYVNTPAAAAPPGGWPVVAYMHGMMCPYAPYKQIVEHYASHGFAVIFPFIKGPIADSIPPKVTNTNGSVLVKAVAFAAAATADAASPLHGLLDTDRLALAGHSMGATDSLRAVLHLDAGVVKVSITQHPGICNYGPPPYPYTWNHAEFANISMKAPVVFMTSANDNAFRPMPFTGEAEQTCFEGGVNATPPGEGRGAAFVMFSGNKSASGGPLTCHGSCYGAVPKDGIEAGGHCCPFKAAPETPWVVTSLKLYLHHGGRRDSRCYSMLWGDGADSLSRDPAVDHTILSPPPAAAAAAAA